MNLLPIIILVILLLSCSNDKVNFNHDEQLLVDAATNSNKAKNIFIDWAKKNHQSINNFTELEKYNDFGLLGKSIGSSKIVAISEGYHNSKENILLNNRLISYLIKKKGFNTIVFESGLPESRKVNDYIHGKPIEENEWLGGISTTYSEWEEGVNLFNWLKLYNESNNEKINIYGIDIAGEYNNWQNSLNSIYSYLNDVDLFYSNGIQNKLKKYTPLFKERVYANYYNKVSPSQKNEIDILFKNIINHLESNKSKFIAKSNQLDFEWSLQTAKSLLQASCYYQNIMDRWGDKSKYVGLNGREIAMASNFEWVYDKDTTAKIIIVSHVIHNKTKTQFQYKAFNNLYGDFTPMNQLIKRRHENEMYVIGLCYGKGFYWRNWQNIDSRKVDTIPSYSSNGLEETFSSVSKSNHYTIFKDAPKYIEPWLNKELELRENDYSIILKPNEWDAVIYLDSVYGATPIN